MNSGEVSEQQVRNISPVMIISYKLDSQGWSNPPLFPEETKVVESETQNQDKDQEECNHPVIKYRIPQVKEECSHLILATTL